ncbi:OmpP1/FadL family transporter [Oceanibium sediminis]|uniref:OmpP1/FadL family transporter n=1 Tax=Oceanibium sediminis TaxID=2026339 RepID=UPI001300198B|nr:outer membrane protein transport protein [Oceanibium sediminis]
MNKGKIRLSGQTLIFALAGTTALAGGLERSVLNTSPLFEEGRYLEFSGALVLPDLSGDGGTIPPAFGGPLPLSGNTGNLLESYATLGVAYKADINDSLSYAIIVNQPLGANTAYPTGSAPSPLDAQNVYGGSSANLTSVALTGLLAYDVTERIKIFGGPVLQTLTADASIAFLSDYAVETNTSAGIGYTLGAAYSVPDIALRVGVTYRSAIEHDLDTRESSLALGTNATQTTLETPQSVTLDAQTGIAKDTLLFGQINWVDWSEFAIAPPNYTTLTGGRPLVDYQEDWTTYTLGVGRRFSETWSGAVSFSYEPQTKTELTSLGPIDGRYGVSLGATHETDRYKVSGGVSYSVLGNARNVLDTDYDNGSALGVGLRIGFKL